VASFLRRVRKRTWIIVGAVGALAIGGTAVYVFGFAIPGAAQGSAQARGFETTAQASLQTLEKTVTASGTLAPLVDEEVSWDGAGTVLTLDVVAGQTVAVGDALGTIDTLQLDAALLQAQATLASARARLADARSASSGSTADTASIAAAAASVSVAEAEVADAQAARDGAALLAPVAGVVTAVNVAVGDSVGASSPGAGGGGSSSASTSTAAFTIVGVDAWEVSTSVGEADVALLALDDAVHLTTDDGTALDGVVTEVGMLPSTSSGAAQYPVTVAIDGTADGLFDGVSVDLEIVYESRAGVLTVPSAAVTTADDGTSTVTLIGSDGTRTTTTVEVGETVGGLTEILSGLAEGDEVLVASFTPGEGNAGQSGQLPDFGEGGFPGGDGGTFPGGDGGAFPGGGQGGFPGGTQGGQGANG
jgi:macrolide-specific efflux system membrane fusion protein